MINVSEINETLSTYVKPQTNPIAIKMLKSENEILKDAKKPLKEFGAQFTLCQAITLTRRGGISIVLDRDSESCPIALVGLGFVNPREYLTGEHVVVPVNQSIEARKNAAKGLPRFKFGDYKYILIAPLQNAHFAPDVILFYGDGAQIMRMIQGAAFSSGEAVTSKSVGSGGCIQEIVAPVLEGKCTFCVPGNGARLAGLVADDELVFAMPKNKFEDVMKGLKSSHEGFQAYPICSGFLQSEHKMPPPYVELKKILIESSH
jgi:uncharacterized protein (DUF169 family)